MIMAEDDQVDLINNENQDGEKKPEADSIIIIIVNEEGDTIEEVCENDFPLELLDFGEVVESLPKSPCEIVNNPKDHPDHEVCRPENDISLSSSTRECKNRKFVANPKEWSRHQAKLRRMHGDTYVGSRRKNPKTAKVIQRDVRRECRKMGPRCASTLCAKWKTRLCDTISEEDRQLLFKTFWQNMDWKQKEMFVCSSVEVKPTGRKTTNKPSSRRKSTPFYFLKIHGKKVPVCRAMFLSTLGLNRSMVKHWLKTFHKDSSEPDKKNTEEGESEEEGDEIDITSEMRKDEVKNHDMDMEKSQPSTSHEVLIRIEENQPSVSGSAAMMPNKLTFLREFFQRIPKLPSHYCRKNSQKGYLQTDIKSWSQLYELYKSECAENHEHIVSRFTFDRVRKNCDIALHVPKKDRCDLCYSHEKKISNGFSEDFYIQHRIKKEEAQNEKELDKAKALNGECHTLCCDMMAVQTVPNIRASSAYFKLKLAIHNFTIYDMNTRDAMNYWFDETQSCLNASTFASLLVDYITELLDQSSKTVIIYSDGCGYQNRNAVLANALLHLSVEKKVTIVQKYLVKGHTYMECDSVHSHVESAFKNTDIYLPHGYVQLSKNARKSPGPYRSVLVDFNFFKNFGRTDMLTYPSIRPGKRAGDPTVNDISVLHYDPAGKISYKLNFSDELQYLPYRPKPITRAISSFPQLLETRPKIPRDKYEDLQWLKKMLPIDCHSFYETIPYEEESRRDAKRQHIARKMQQKI